jgi:SAM-dependent methyltransferase
MQNPYDVVAYPRLAFSDTHPERLATMAILHGISPAPVEHCRVLEVACNEGGNLIPMAYAIPGSEFVGFDLARAPVERGQERIRELELKNIRIFAADLLEMGGELGEFDYIIAHGFYSWAPAPVRERLLALCDELLAPNGIAFVSYNALPGGFVRDAIREIMLFRMDGTEHLDQQVREAFGLVHFLLASLPEDDAYRQLMEKHLKRMEEHSAPSTFHDELSEAFYTVSFAEFMRHARKHNLQYMSEAALPPPPDPYYRQEIRTAIEKIAPGDVIAQEQMLDFARARKFRQTLLCRVERTVRRDYPPEHFRRLLLASQAKASADASPGATAFTLPGDIKMEVNHPGVITLMRELERAWPRALSCEEIEPLLVGSGLSFDATFAVLLMRLAVAKFVELHAWRPALPARLPERPRTSASSRQEVRARSQAVTLIHSMVRLDDAIAQKFFLLLDGTRDRGALLEALAAEFPEIPAEELGKQLEPSLEFFYRAGFIEA